MLSRSNSDSLSGKGGGGATPICSNDAFALPLFLIFLRPSRMTSHRDGDPNRHSPHPPLSLSLPAKPHPSRRGANRRHGAFAPDRPMTGRGPSAAAAAAGRGPGPAAAAAVGHGTDLRCYTSAGSNRSGEQPTNPTRHSSNGAPREGPGVEGGDGDRSTGQTISGPAAPVRPVCMPEDSRIIAYVRSTTPQGGLGYAWMGCREPICRELYLPYDLPRYSDDGPADLRGRRSTRPPQSSPSVPSVAADHNR